MISRTRKILFLGSQRKVFAVEVHTDPEFRAGDPELTFKLEAGMENSVFDLTQDGSRALVGDISAAVEEDAETRSRVTVVLNWFDILKERVVDSSGG